MNCVQVDNAKAGILTPGRCHSGDAKLAAATALWIGFDQLLNDMICASLLGGLLALAVMRFRLMPLPAVLADQKWAKRLHRMDAGVPYGIALASRRLRSIPTRPG